MTILKNILILCQLLPLVRTINTRFFPCDADVNASTVDCYSRSLKTVPKINSPSVKTINLSRTQIKRVGPQDFSGLPELTTLLMMDNCQPGSLKALEESCEMEIDDSAFKSLTNLQFVNLSGNSLTSIPWFPESLRVLDLTYNRIFDITRRLGTPKLDELYFSGNCFYANPCHNSFHISEDVLGELSNLKNLSLGYINLTVIPKGLPHSLEYLNLKENTIPKIPEGAFANLTNLKFLSVEWNCQRCDHAARPCFPCPNSDPLHLHPRSFYSANSSITYLSLRGNSLTNIPKGLFQSLKNLKKLDLSDNLLYYTIQNGTFFSELTGLTWISLIYNYEPHVTFADLSLSAHVGNISGLQYLLLSGNFFHTLSNKSLEVLSKLKHLKKLELRMNFINSLNIDALARLPSLIYIDLSQNVLSFLPCCQGSSPKTVAQESCQNRHLYQLGVSENPLKLRDQDVTSETDMWASNGREVLSAGVSQSSNLWMQHCKHNLTYDLSQNNIMYLDRKVFKGMEKAVCLDLSFNYISQALRKGVFNDMKNLVFLNLSYNRLDFYYNGSFSELNTTLKVLDLSNNEFHFKMRGMGHSFYFIQNLTNLEVLSLANNLIGMRVDERLFSSSITSLYFYGNELHIMWESDNTKYMHFFQDLTNLTYLDISHNKLKSISHKQLCNLPRSIQNLIVSNNQLIYFPWPKIYIFGNLSHLDLSQNKLSYLPRKEVKFGVRFSLLDLSHNRITSIPQEFFSDASSLQYLYLGYNLIKEINHQFLPALFQSSSGLRTLTLHANPFKCDCDTAWFVDFLRNTSIDIPYLTTSVHCEFPESLQGVSILSIDQHSCQDIYGRLAFFVCTLLVVAFTVLPLLKHLYGWDLWYCLQVLWAGYKGYSQLAGKNSTYLYDAFVVFDTSNQAVRDWVYNELMINLENSPHRRFCLCLEERDWDLGLSCIDNLHNAVYSSMKTMFVLSTSAPGHEAINGVIRQTFFMVQQRLLDEKVDTAVLVLLDEMFPKLKYLQLRKRLCRKSVLSWPKNPKAQPLFWNQLRMALSSDNISHYDNKMSESFV